MHVCMWKYLLQRFDYTATPSFLSSLCARQQKQKPPGMRWSLLCSRIIAICSVDVQTNFPSRCWLKLRDVVGSVGKDSSSGGHLPTEAATVTEPLSFYCRNRNASTHSLSLTVLTAWSVTSTWISTRKQHQNVSVHILSPGRMSWVETVVDLL